MNNKSKKHWLVLLVCCGLIASSVGICVNATGVFYAPIADSLGILRGTVALQTTVSLLAASTVSLWIPKIMQKYAFKRVLWSSVVVAGVATMAMAFSKNMLVFQILGVIRGASSAMFSIVPLTMIINNWFDQKRGLATSIVLSFSGVAGAVFSPILTSCIAQIGWENTYIVVGIVFIILCLPALCIPFSMEPQEEGLLPYGYEENNVKETQKESTGTFQFLQVSFFLFFVFSVLHTAISGITQHLPGFAESISYSASTGAMLLSAGMLGNILSKLSIGVLSDRLDALKASLIMMAVNMVSIVLLVWAPNEMVLILGAFLFGSVYAVAAVGCALLTNYFFGKENYVKVYPVISFATGVGSAFAITLIGYLYDYTGSYYNAFLIAMIFHVVNIVLLIIAKKIVYKKELRTV